jgi:hypothetical protein
MSGVVFEIQRRRAELVLDCEDGFRRDLGFAGPHPRAVGPLRFWLTGRRVAAIIEPIVPPLELEVIVNPSGYHLFFGKVKDKDGRTLDLDAEPGVYLLRVEGGLYQRAEIEVEFETLFAPSTPRPGLRQPFLVDLQPGYAYPFPRSGRIPRAEGPTLLRGVIASNDGSASEDILVDVDGVTQAYRTGANGQWVLTFPDTQPDGNVSLRFRFPASPEQIVTGVPLRRGFTSTFAQAALKGMVLNGGQLGIRDATITVARHPGSVKSHRNGDWIYYFGLNQADEIVDVTATLPDGRRLTQAAFPVRQRATVVMPAFRFA